MWYAIIIAFLVLAVLLIIYEVVTLFNKKQTAINDCDASVAALTKSLNDLKASDAATIATIQAKLASDAATIATMQSKIASDAATINDLQVKNQALTTQMNQTKRQLDHCSAYANECGNQRNIFFQYFFDIVTHIADNPANIQYNGQETNTRSMIEPVGGHPESMKNDIIRVYDAMRANINSQ